MTTIVVLFQTGEDLERAIAALERYGLARHNIQVINALIPDDRRPNAGEGSGGIVPGTGNPFHVGDDDAVVKDTGAAITGAAAIGASNLGASTGWAPGAFPLAVSSSIADQLAARGVPRDEADFYERSLKGSASLVIIDAADKDRAAEIQDLLRRSNAVTPNRQPK